MIAAAAPPPVSRIDAAANCALPANVVADMTIAASAPKPASCVQPERGAEEHGRGRERESGEDAVAEARAGHRPTLPADADRAGRPAPSASLSRRCGASRRG